MNGYTQKEAAETVGIVNNSGVSKRPIKLRRDFEKDTGVKFE